MNTRKQAFVPGKGILDLKIDQIKTYLDAFSNEQLDLLADIVTFEILDREALKPLGQYKDDTNPEDTEA